jgi:flagella basal body P-ring formation protein FlgA
MRNDYGIRPRAQMLKGGGIATRGTGQALKKGGMADMITAKMSKKKKGKMMKGKR